MIILHCNKIKDGQDAKSNRSQAHPHPDSHTLPYRWNEPVNQTVSQPTDPTCQSRIKPDARSVRTWHVSHNACHHWVAPYTHRHDLSRIDLHHDTLTHHYTTQHSHSHVSNTPAPKQPVELWVNMFVSGTIRNTSQSSKQLTSQSANQPINKSTSHQSVNLTTI